LKDVKEVSPLQTFPMLVLAGLCVFFGIFYYIPLKLFIYPALNIQPDAVIFGVWESQLATTLIIVGIILGIVLFLVGILARKVRIVPTWICGEIQENEEMIIPGTHFYKTVSSMGGLKQLYSGQEKGYFDLYNQFGALGFALTSFLRWLHSGVLSMYLTWVILGLLILLFVVCRIW
jgi:NADH:ubiquinone oxidoreductase subunit 5 (subunit L)/multisubunit Na+/H+ antiporter MnhA subunit